MIRLALAFCFLIVFGTPAVWAEETSSDNTRQVKFFEERIRPLLKTHCVKCHGEQEQEGELRLDSLQGMLKGGVSGAAVVPGKPDASLLLIAVRYQNADLQMPPEARLNEKQLADLTRWVRDGAAHPDSLHRSHLRTDPEIDWQKERQFWVFQPPKKSALPTVKKTEWPQTPIDDFLLAQLEQRGLKPAPPADKHTLLRRVTFDLTGLPPTPDEMTRFLNDASPGAFHRVVERLLASPAYGERWGRHWLDVARYADSNGLDENIAFGNAWRYRDWVISAFNADVPYDQFVRLQLAGDLIADSEGDPNNYENLIATGFLSLGPKVLAEVDQTKMEMDIIDEQLDTVGRAFMGLTLGCARCHDHKFDPITQKDYYALAGIFKSTKTMEHYVKIARWYEHPIPSPEDLQSQRQYQEQLADVQSEIDSTVKAANEELLKSLEENAKLPEKPETQYPDETKTKLKSLRDQLAKLKKSPPVTSTALGVGEREVKDLPIHIRGSHLSLGEMVPRRFPTILSEEKSTALTKQQSGRLELANWLASPEHPLTSRVMVNRIWRWHFGTGLVISTDNFGKLGTRPINQPLLDWLAVHFQEQNWSIKQMHRLIVHSSTYQMSSQYDPQAMAIDPQNRYQWRSRIRRLEAEAVRDSLLAVSGLLDRSMGGSQLHVKNREFFFNHTSEDKTTYDSTQRAVYLPVVRNHLYDVFQLFDYSDASVSNGNRTTSTVAPQALFLMNSQLVRDAVDSLADRVLTADCQHDAARVSLLYQITLTRAASNREQLRALSFLKQFAATLDPKLDKDTRTRQSWAALAQVLVASNEFLHLR